MHIDKDFKKNIHTSNFVLCKYVSRKITYANFEFRNFFLQLFLDFKKFNPMQINKWSLKKQSNRKKDVLKI